MNRSEIHKKIHYLLALLIAFSLPFARLTPVFIVLLFSNWLIEGDLKNKLNLFLKNKIAILFTSLYLIHVVGLLYSEDLNRGTFDLQVKLSILLFPLIFSNRPFTSPQLKGILTSLTIGSVTSCLFLLGNAVYLLITKNEFHFYYQNYSILMHPSYLAMYLNLAIAWLFIFLTQKKRKTAIMFPIVLVILFLVLNIVISSSKSGILMLALIFAFYTSYQLIKNKNYKPLIAGILISGLSLYGVATFLPQVAARLYKVITSIEKGAVNDTESYDSTNIRLLIWQTDKDLIQENTLIGVGPGDVKGILKNEYEKRKMIFAFQNELNAHSVFLQITLGLGLIGLIVLMANLLIPLYLSFKKRNFVYMAFVSIIIVNFLPESMLEVQAGTMFYGFFNSLLYFSESSNS